MRRSTLLPREWVRGPQWISDQARDTWEPVLRRAQAAWSELELGSVGQLRDSAMVHLSCDEVPRAASDCSGVGLQLSVLAFNGDLFRAAVHRLGAAADWHRAWSAGDDEEIGTLLGFPACCRAFFRSTWGFGSSDPTPYMRRFDGPWEASIALRWIGVRLVPHLPCSGQCAETARQARAYLDLGREMGVDVEAIEALLRLPAKYSAVNGVAIVETPHFRFMAGCDEAEGEVRLERQAKPSSCGKVPGDRDPAYHYDVPYDTAAQPAAQPVVQPAPWADNGFSSAAAMEASHAVVARVVGRVAEAIDLGAGDGTLLARVAGSGIAVEADPERAARGRQRHPHLVFRVEQIRTFVRSHPGGTLALLMPGRLLEAVEEDAAAIRTWLRRCTRVVLYAYGDWLTRDADGLAGLARRAGLRLVGPVIRDAGVEAAEGSAL